MEITELDPYDEAALRAWHAVVVRADSQGREHASPWLLDEARPELRDPGRRRRLIGYAGTEEGRVVCAAALSLPQLDNLNTASLNVSTDPDRRRRGHGSAMLAHLERRAAADGRHLLNTETIYPYDAPTDGAGHPGPDFLTHRGFAFGLGDVHRVLDLPVDPALLDRLAAEAAPHHASYRIEVFPGPVPDPLLTSFAELSASLVTEAPVGEVEREPEVADPAALREDEAQHTAQGRSPCIAVALDAFGEAVAYTTVMTTRHTPDRGYQWGTVVRRDHRGHRLGMAVKVANLRLLQAHTPAVQRLFTYNAEVNDHMLAINDALGFRPIERLGEFQKRLG